jgi:hypothetical protein
MADAEEWPRERRPPSPLLVLPGSGMRQAMFSAAATGGGGARRAA